MEFRASMVRYEAWLTRALAGELVAADLAAKHAKLAGGPFPFLRATYWRWAETVLTVCPELAGARPVLAVGDIHLENFGTWRDADGRLAWGVNDFDEAADMPWPLDPLRLAVSALLARPGGDAAAVAAAILDGYGRGLTAPGPFVLEEKHRWLREAVLVPEADRARFWDKLAALDAADDPELTAGPGERWRLALGRAMPAGAGAPAYHRRVAGAGSLGRPRWLAVAQWRGGTVVREAKAVVASAWGLAHGVQPIRCAVVATGAFRVPDPWFAVADGIAVRRLSPNNRKIEVAGDPELLLSARMLGAMGHELASIHAAGSAGAALGAELAGLQPGWLAKAASRAAAAVAAEQAAYARG